MKIIFSFFDSLYHCKRELFPLFHKNKRIFIKKTLKQDLKKLVKNNRSL